MSGCRAGMDGAMAERMDAKLAEDAAAGDGGAKVPLDRTLGFAFSALICCQTAFR